MPKLAGGGVAALPYSQRNFVSAIASADAGSEAPSPRTVRSLQSEGQSGNLRTTHPSARALVIAVSNPMQIIEDNVQT